MDNDEGEAMAATSTKENTKQDNTSEQDDVTPTKAAASVNENTCPPTKEELQESSSASAANDYSGYHSRMLSSPPPKRAGGERDGSMQTDNMNTRSKSALPGNAKSSLSSSPHVDKENDKENHKADHQDQGNKDVEEKIAESADANDSTSYPEPESLHDESTQHDNTEGSAAAAADYLALKEVGSFADSPRKSPTSRQPRILQSPQGSSGYPYGGVYPYSVPHHPHYASMYPYGPPPQGGPHSSNQKNTSSAPPLHHYPYPPPPPGYHPHHTHPHHRGYYPPYHLPPHMAATGGPDPWTSPQAYETELLEEEQEDAATASNLKDAFRPSPVGSPRRHQRSSPMDEDDESAAAARAAATPEKMLRRSPFRSPPMSQTKKSPMFRSPALGNFGSFGMMDTPGGTLGGTLAAEYSPMGPMLSNMGNPFASGFGDAPTPTMNLSLSRSNSDHEMDLSDPAAEDGEPSSLPNLNSPFSGFMNDHFPSSAKKTRSHISSVGGLQGVSRSPLRSERRALASDPRDDRPPVSFLTSTHPDSSRKPKGAAGNDIPSSPLGHASSAKPRKLWEGPPEPIPGGSLRLELGGNSTLKKSLDGWNSRMRSQHPPLGNPAGPSSYSRHHLPPGHSYRRLNTPIKLDPSPMHSKAMGPSTGQKRTIPNSAKSAREEKIPRSAGKENITFKRTPCNCKKSKCLKLYCECFAAELVCDGCNCSDCQNNDDFASIREKAMKDTRAKNPNAFKPRIGNKGMSGAIAVGTSPQNGHNMGCRCKRSECLKKYCECFQAGVMCGAKCKCVECMNFAGSQKLIDKRRKIKDQRGAELAMKVAEQAWKGTQNSARKPPVARPAIHGMRPMPSPVATPGGRVPMHNYMMHPSPSGHRHPYMRPMLMGPPHGHMGYSPMGMHPHVSPSGYMYPPPHHQYHHPPPTPSLGATRRTSPTASATKSDASESVKMPYNKTVSAKETPSRDASRASPLSAVKFDASADKESETSPMAAHPDKDDSSSEKQAGGTPRDRPDSGQPVHPTPAETMKPGPAKITPMPGTPAPAVRLADADDISS